MLASINPLGERARNQRWGVTYAFYLLGSAAGGATLGVVTGAAGAAAHRLVDPPSAVVATVVVLACLLAVALDLHVGGLRSPTVHRQVNEDWLERYRGWFYGLGFGYQLGLGVVTVVTTASVHLMMVLAFLTGSPGGGLVIGIAFGLVRAVPLLTVAGVRVPGQLVQAVRRADDQDRVARRASLAIVLVVALVAGTVLMGSLWWLS
jgi:hypothetical protein